MRLTIRRDDITLDVDVTIVDPEVPIGEVFTALTGRLPGPEVVVDGWPYRADDAVGLVPLHNGSVIGGDVSSSVDSPVSSSFRLTKVAGDGAGKTWDLQPGITDVGYGTGDYTDRPEFRLKLVGDLPPTVSRLNNDVVLVDGQPIVRDEEHGFERISVGRDVFRIDRNDEVRQLPMALSESGRLPHQRPPRRQPTESRPTPVQPSAPDDPKEPGTFSWVVLIVPIPLAIGAVFFFKSPFFLLFILMSPLLALGRFFEGKRRAAKDRRRYAEESSELAIGYAAALRAWRADLHRDRHRNRPDIGQLCQKIRSRNPGLWERRPDHGDFLTLDVGFGDVSLNLDRTDFDPVNAVGLSANMMSDVPITIDLAADGAIGIVGDRSKCQEMAAALLVQTAIEHGPADVLIGLLLEPGVFRDWDWIKWAPHLEDDRGFRYVATDATGAAAFLGSLAPPPADSRNGRTATLPRPLPVVAVDGDVFLSGSFTALSTAIRSGSARAIVVAEKASDLPAICSLVVEIGDDGEATVTSMTSGRIGCNVAPTLLDRGRAADTLRQLSAYSDPERSDEGSDLPQMCDLRSLIGGELTAPVIAEHWARGAKTPAGVIGVAQHGPLRLDLVDDGPHALIAGTTGSGKSELLRTLVASLAWAQGPDKLNFVLVDFKGGGAFDACADLPHTVGVVTDLDEHLAARALRCLKAELKYRERKLREAGVSDLRDYDNPNDPLARLVVVVDEFATLAAELPDFMASLVDVAQRGRSLGIHMILATQRPSGVVDAKIRANTNLRVSLRVQDIADSDDVIGDRRAASIDRRSPGRGYVRLGASELVQFQTALVSEASSTDAPLPLRITGFELSTPIGHAETPSTASTGSQTDLASLVDAANSANAHLALPAARVPWPAPLPTSVEATTLDGAEDPAPWTAPIGLVDLPDEQRTETFWWTPEVGNLAVYGNDTAATSAVLATLVLGLARGNDSDQAHVYLIDFSGGGTFSDLGEVPHVGAVVTPSEEERLIRVIDLLENELNSRSELARAAGTSRIGPDSGLPLTVLAIANYGAMLAYLEETNQFELGNRFERVVRDGPGLGVYMVATANHERGIPARVAGQIESRLILRMADPNSYSAFGLRLREMPDLGPGRAVDPGTGLEVQMAHYGDAQGIIGDLSPVTSEQGPGRVAVLGTDIAPDGIIDQSQATDRSWRLAFGQQHTDLAVAALDLRPGSNVVVSGSSGSGKSTVLRALAMAARQSDPNCQLMVADQGDPWPMDVTVFDPEAIDPDRRTLILIDGMSWISDEAAKALEDIDRTTTWLVVADWPEALQSMPPPWLRKVLASRTGLLLQPQPDHGEILRSRLPLRAAKEFPPGRGFLVAAGVARLVQVANAETEDVLVSSAYGQPSPSITK